MDVINTAFQGVDAHRVWHICYGNQGGNPGVSDPRGQDMFPFAFDADVDQIHIEAGRRGPGDLQYLAGLPDRMSLGVGVIDAHRDAAGGLWFAPGQVAALARAQRLRAGLERLGRGRGAPLAPRREARGVERLRPHGRRSPPLPARA